MKKLLYSLILLLAAFTAQAQTLAVTMVTTATVGSAFSFDIGATADNTPIKVDWGDGSLTDYNVGTGSSNVVGMLAGRTIKVYGEGITYLYLQSKSLTALDLSGATVLTRLYCAGNQLTTLDVTNNIALTTLYCSGNQLTTLDVSNNNSLNSLDCVLNQLTNLDISNNTALYSLFCSYNQLANLVVSNNTTLSYLDCSTNQLTFSTLPVRMPSWTKYYFSPQATFKLPKNKYAINEVIDLSSQLTANGNTTTYLWKTAGGSTLVKGVDYSEDNGKFTFIKEQGDYLFCQMTNASFPELTLTTETITVPSAFPAITMTTTNAAGSTFSFDIEATAKNTPIKVDWGDGSLTNYNVGTGWLNVSGTLTGSTIKVYGVGIAKLSLSSNNITTLDLSGATVLTSLNCENNQLTTFDVSKNTALTDLYCESNQLTNLDVSKNTALTYLRCYSNQLTNLDVSNNIALIYLYCYSNQLTNLDVSTNTALTTLSCYSNQLTSLDVSTNTALTDLVCSNNKLTVLDVSKNTALTTLWCSSNQLTSLDVSKNTALTSLSCSSNQLTLSTLPIKQPAWTYYYYSPQSALKLPKKNYITSEAIDLSSQLTANGNTTAFTLRSITWTTLTSDVDYNVSSGVYTFLKEQSDSVYCAMTNASFPDLTLKTTKVKITTDPTSVEETEVKVTVFPNPVSDNLFIESVENIVRVEIFTITGLTVYSIDGNDTNTMTLSVASCPKGLLIVKVYGRNGVMERKVIKD